MGHHGNITRGDVPSAEIVGVCDVDPAKLETHEKYGYKTFTDSDKLIEWAAAGNADAIVIATPHYYHTTIAIAAIGAGLNVLTEKPLSVHKADCEKVIAAFEARPDRTKIFSEMFNQRTDKTYIKMRSMVQGGELGEFRRMNWIITNWFRTQSYVRSPNAASFIRICCCIIMSAQYDNCMAVRSTIMAAGGRPGRARAAGC